MAAQALSTPPPVPRPWRRAAPAASWNGTPPASWGGAPLPSWRETRHIHPWREAPDGRQRSRQQHGRPRQGRVAKGGGTRQRQGRPQQRPVSCGTGTSGGSSGGDAMSGRLVAPPSSAVVDRAEQGAPVARRATRVGREEGPHRSCSHRCGRGGTQRGRRQGHRPRPPSPEAGRHWGGRAGAGHGRGVRAGQGRALPQRGTCRPNERVGPRQGRRGGRRGTLPAA